MGKKVLSTFVLCFYIAIIMYVFFAVIHTDSLANFGTAIVFEVISFVFWACFLRNIFLKPIRIEFFVPLLMVTVVYTIVLDVIDIAFIMSMSHVFFLLINLIILFVYCLVSIPMYIMGRR